jgi:hypothetical protein
MEIERSVELLEYFKEYGDTPLYGQGTEAIVSALVNLVLEQKEQISALQEYVEEQKELEKGREADNYHRYQMSLSDFT